MKINANRIRRLRRALTRGVTLVEVLIVVAIMALISSGAVFVGWPEYKKAQIKTAVTSANTIKAAAEVFMHMGDGSGNCPTIQDLVSAKQIDGKKIDDPWGTPYKILCGEGEINVISVGKDKKENTPDDVRDDFKASDVDRVGKL